MKSLRNLFVVGVFSGCVMSYILDFAIAEQNKLEGRQFQPIAKEEISNVFNLISSKTKSNLEKIKTWQGDVDYTINLLFKGDAAEEVFRNKTTGQGKTPQTILQTAFGTKKFIIDLTKGCNYDCVYRAEPMQYIDTSSGVFLNTLPELSFPLHRIFIVTPEGYLEYAPNKYKDSTSGIVSSGRVIKKPLEKSVKKNISDQRDTVLKEGMFDPRNMVYMEDQLWDYLARCQKRFEKNTQEPKDDLIDLPPTKCEVNRDGNDIVYHVLTPFRTAKTEYIFMSSYFASEAGYNLIKSEILGSKLQKHFNTEIEYSIVDGIYIPNCINFFNYDVSDGSIVQERKYILNNQQLNHSIPAETFTYKNLGLKNDDRFVDKIEKKEYKYKDANLVFVADVNK
ncbi:MAG: hypothetical protein WCE45_08805 [Sedimentisphaerales bacterium]